MTDYTIEDFTVAILRDEYDTKTIKFIDNIPKRVKHTFEAWKTNKEKKDIMLAPLKEWARKIDESRQ